MSTLLITGANGLLGTKLLQRALLAGHRVVGLSRGAQTFRGEGQVPWHQVDIRDGVGVLQVVREAGPDVIVHTAAITDVDACELRPGDAWETNLMGTGHVVLGALEMEAYLVFLSSDYVFSGEAGPYRESDEPGPARSVYGRTKLAGEALVLDRLPGAGVARTSLLYGQAAHTRLNFVSWLVTQLRQGRKATAVTDQVGSPTLADNLADMVLAMVKRQTAGVVHATGPEWFTRYEYAIRVARAFKLDEGLIQEGRTRDLKQPAPRPRHSGLLVERAEKELGVRPVGLDEGLARVRAEMPGG